MWRFQDCYPGDTAVLMRYTRPVTTPDPDATTHRASHVPQQGLTPTAKPAVGASDDPRALVRKQHTVSASLLRRFATGSSQGAQVTAVNLRTGRSKPTSIRRAGVVNDFITADSKKMEDIWGQVENRLPEAIDAAEAGTVLDDPRLCAVLRDAIALHYIRCETTKTVMTRVRQQTAPAVLRAAVRDRRADFERQFPLHMSGLVPAGDEALLYLAERLAQDTLNTLASPEYTRFRFEDVFEKAKAHASGWSLEVVKAVDGEFLIGDVPVVTSRAGSTGLGMADIPLGDASQIVMPLTPSIVVSVGPSPSYGTVPRELVDELNRRQVVAANERVFHRVGADFTDFIAANRPGFGAQPRGPLT